MKTHISPITVNQFFSAPNAEALLAEYAAECAIAGLPAPMPSREMYEAIEASGMARVIGAFCDDRLVGFIVLLVSFNPHYSAKLAVCESYFVGKDHRKSGAGLRLRNAAVDVAVDLGAKGIFICAPKGGKLAEVMEKSGDYIETNRVFFRGLA